MKIKNLKKKLAIIALVIVLGVVGFFGYKYYLFEYRYKVEPETDLTETNTEPLRDLDSLNETILEYTNNSNYKVTEDNSYVIPGLVATKTLDKKKISMCTSMTPQGICTTEDYIFISAYCHTHEHNSVLYMLEKKSHKFIKEIVVNGKYHLGNICYDPENKTIWCAATGKNPLTGKECAYLDVLSLEDIENYNLDKTKSALSFNKKYPLTGFKNASFISYYKGNIFVGIYYTGIWKNAYVQRFPIDENGKLETKKKKGKTIAAGKEKAKISGLCQGIFLTDNYIALMQSDGTDDSAVQYFVDSEYKKDCDTMISFDQMYKAYVKREKSIKVLEEQYNTIESEYEKALENGTEIDDELKKILTDLFNYYNDEYNTLEKCTSLFSKDFTEKEYKQLIKDLNKIKSKINKINQKLEDYKEENAEYLTDSQFIKVNELVKNMQNSLSNYENAVAQFKDALDELSDFNLEEYQAKLKETKNYDITDSKAYFKLTFPPRLEQAMESSLDESKVFVLFESAAYAYRAQNDGFIDRVIVVDTSTE